ncbi:MAG: SDR family NAD(P)-dependent oxidoreductase [Candidatus Cloacimonetes bacterium]|nr:SDR family NAD(P)-dependent oxidoreductase [Candidatus Cloacimonadota bacterium]
MKSVLVTGGAGFIGSVLCDTLLDQGFRVVCVDNLCDFYSPTIKRRNISAALENPNYLFIEADIRDSESINSVFAKHQFDIVVHLAAMAGVRPSIENPEGYFTVNVMGTLNILNACIKQGVKKLIFASSSSVYGDNPVPFKETDNVDNPISPYAATKKAGELLCYTWHHLYAMSIVCLRFFTVYGPRQRPDLAIHKFTKLIMQGESVPFFGNGNTSRDYTYIDDIITGISSSIKLAYDSDNPIYEVINLGSSTPVSLSEMIETIEKTIGKRARILHYPVQPGDVQRTFAEISKAEMILGYKQNMPFSKGIALFYEWFKSVAGS